jgi:hypothetical protein
MQFFSELTSFHIGDNAADIKGVAQNKDKILLRYMDFTAKRHSFSKKRKKVAPDP